MNKIPSWLLLIVAVIVTVDQWMGATGEADPFALMLSINEKTVPVSIMAGARGIVIAVGLAYALTMRRNLKNNKHDRTISHVITTGAIAMLIIETLVIAPYTMATLAKTPTALQLNDVSPALQWGWSVLVSGMSLLTVGVVSVASLAEKIERVRVKVQRGERRPVGRPPKETKHIRDEKRAK